MTGRVDHLLEFWDPENGGFLEKSDEHFVGMRSAPTSYQAFFLLGLSAWKPWRPSLEPMIPKLVAYIRRNLKSFDEYTMPFMRVYHMVLLMKHSSRDYVVHEFKPRIDQLIVSPV